MRKVILYIAMSLDGYIAGEGDDLSFLDGYDALNLVRSSYQTLLSRIDTIIMGRRTFDWIKNYGGWPYNGYKTYVLTSKPTLSQDVIMTDLSPKELLSDLIDKDEKDIWLVGGGKLVQSMLADHLIDEITVAIIPTLLGHGIRLFDHVSLKLNLTHVEHEGGLILITYQNEKV